ncbi:ATP-binding protein [Streptacidiphilus anmyonensis]|uniref:ATP-binding protein n=1 Tax=Streptacidiphilus anmyonensis TaxID=405782 RepID=UPI00191BE995|nr:ATP-binding protein [Streptacidiphilus anmyonensis]
MASVGERLSSARVQAFVGRDEELERFADALAGEADAPFAFYVFGPGGIGKSTLLRRLADQARAVGRTILDLDGRFVSRDPADFEREAAPFLGAPGTVLFVDSFEHCQWLESGCGSASCRAPLTTPWWSWRAGSRRTPSGRPTRRGPRSSTSTSWSRSPRSRPAAC